MPSSCMLSFFKNFKNFKAAEKVYEQLIGNPCTPSPGFTNEDFVAEVADIMTIDP